MRLNFLFAPLSINNESIFSDLSSAMMRKFFDNPIHVQSLLKKRNFALIVFKYLSQLYKALLQLA